MKVVLARSGKNWGALVNKELHILTPVGKVHLDHILGAIRRVHSSARIHGDRTLTNNPFLREYLSERQRLDIEPDWEDVLEALNYPEKHCTLCGGPAWYHPTLRNYECSECHQRVSLVGESFGIK